MKCTVMTNGEIPSELHPPKVNHSFPGPVRVKGHIASKKWGQNGWGQNCVDKNVMRVSCWRWSHVGEVGIEGSFLIKRQGVPL